MTEQLLDIASIQIDRANRQRREIKTADLEASIAQVGLIQPIVVEDRGAAGIWLRAGERRLTACKNLNHTHIKVTWLAELDPIRAQLVELEENIKRQDLEWQEVVTSVQRIHGLYLDLDPDWTMAETGKATSLAQGTVSMYLRVANSLDNERVAKAQTVREAFNVIGRVDARIAGDALASLLDDPGPVIMPDEVPTSPMTLEEIKAKYGDMSNIKAIKITEIISKETGKPQGLPTFQVMEMVKPLPAEEVLNTSFLEWAPQYSGPKFNLIHCDFPYGVELFSGPQGRGSEPTTGYADKPTTYYELLSCFCQNLDKFMSLSAHLMFWYTADSELVYETLQFFRVNAPSLEFQKFPLIWHKTDNAGIAADSRRSPRHTYELCLLASRGKRQIVKIKADTYPAPTDKTLHPSCKPRPMLEHFFEMLVDGSTSLLDPTCGSGSSLLAADNLGASRVLGLELDPSFARSAEQALKNGRKLKAASKSLSDLL